MGNNKFTLKQKRELLDKIMIEIQPEINKLAKDYEEKKLKKIEAIKFRINEAIKQGNDNVKEFFEKELVEFEAKDSRLMVEELLKWHIKMHILGMRVKGQPYLKKIDKTGRFKFAKSQRIAGRVVTEYVGCYTPETVAFVYTNNMKKEKLLSFEKDDMLYNKIDLFQIWVRGGEYKKEKILAIRTDWNWNILFETEFDAFCYFWKALKGKLLLLKDFNKQKKFEFKVRFETSHF